jgi:hypothetical protein
MSLSKTAVLATIEATLQQNLDMALLAINDAQLSANSETKSSAGDKYETGRSMAMQAVNLYGRQYKQAQEALASLQILQNKGFQTKISAGSLVLTSLGTYYYLGLGLGKILVGDTAVYCISLEAPMAQNLLGLQVGQSFLWQKKQPNILEIN